MDSLKLRQFSRITGSLLGPVTCPAVRFGLSTKHQFSLEQALNPIKLLVTPIAFKPLLHQRVHLPGYLTVFIIVLRIHIWVRINNVLRTRTFQHCDGSLPGWH